MRFLLYSPGGELPLLAALTSLVFVDCVAVRRLGRFALPLTAIGLWALCLAWFWEPKPGTNAVTALSVGFILAIQVVSLLKSRKSLSSSGRILTLNLVIAAVLTFAFPAIGLLVACWLGDCV